MLSCMAWPSPTSSSMSPCNHHISLISSVTLLLTLLSLSNLGRADLSDDVSALLALKGSIGGGGLQSWNASNTASICTTWKGVRCSSNDSSTGRVIQLRLPGSSLSGSIPLQTLGTLDALQVISLRRNRLSGPLPQDLTNCAALRQLILSNNNFSGKLPEDFSAWPLLKKLDLSSNNFSGQIPSSLSNLPNLDTLFLQNNGFSGSIPLLGGASFLNFSVADNQLNGSIPSTLSRFPAESFAGNLDLCGAPLPACISTEPPTPTPTPAPAPPALTPTPSSSEAVSNSTNEDDDDNKLSAGAIAGIVVGGVAVSTILLCICLLLCVRKKKKQGHAEDLYADGRTEFETKSFKGGAMNTREPAINRKGSGKSGDNGGANINNNNKLIFIGNAKLAFDLNDLLRASAEVLGKGSLGTSYKALMGEGKPLSVKRFREVVTEREETCKHIEMLGALQHPNLVPLRAYFFAPKGKLLVSDYMLNGSLTSLLHGKKGVIKELLGWETRLAIAGGAAKGVVFLHSKKIVHGNIKANNVLIDSDNQARLSDYSLVQLMPVSNLQSNAYTPPEARGNLRKITYKGDVYAFGVLLLELVTGLSPTSDSNIDELVQWVQGHFPQHVESVLDPLLVADSDDRVQDDMIALLHIALPCISTEPEKRPHMVEIVSSIENLRKRDDHSESTEFYFTQAV